MSRNLDAALDEAARRVERDPAAGLPAPRPYPALARPGQVWIKAGSYWIRYSTRPRRSSPTCSMSGPTSRGGLNVPNLKFVIVARGGPDATFTLTLLDGACIIDIKCPSEIIY